MPRKAGNSSKTVSSQKKSFRCRGRPAGTSERSSMRKFLANILSSSVTILSLQESSIVKTKTTRVYLFSVETLQNNGFRGEAKKLTWEQFSLF